MATFSLTADVLDIRDLIERFEELESEQEDLKGEWDGLSELDAPAEYLEWEKENGEELDQLREILEELAGNGGDEQFRGDWYPVTLIEDDYFTEYAQELVSDIGDVPRDIPSYIVIDWEATANNIKGDYTSIDIGANTYWYR
jgi:hypothetical protein